MAWLFALARGLFGQLPLCALVGGLVGTFTGFFFGLGQLSAPTVVYTWTDLLRVGLGFGIAGWLLVLFVLAAWFRYRVGQIALVSLVTAVVTAILVVIVLNAVNLPVLSVPIGLVVGLIVGLVFCALCRRFDLPLTRPQRG
jgi:hypothetical protein